MNTKQKRTGRRFFSLLLLLLAAGLQGACADPKKSDFTTSSASVPVIAQDAIASDRSEPTKTSIREPLNNAPQIRDTTRLMLRSDPCN
ncbi:hypothetical protein VC290_21160, partial [Xanthomonas campestris]|nr:hypothetical protein [Xanthomonas campestris]